MSEQVLSLLIKVAKQGNGDVQTVETLEKLKKQSDSAGTSVEALRLVGSRSSETMLRMAGVNEGVIKSLKLLELGHGAVSKGMIISTLATGGLVAAVGAAVTIFQKYAKELDDASKAEIDSAAAANEAEERRRRTLERLGLTARATRAEIQAYIATQIEATAKLEGLASARDSGVTRIDQEAKLALIGQGSSSRLKELRLEQGAVGLEGNAAIDAERNVSRAGLDSTVDAAREKTAGELRKKQQLQEFLVLQQEELNKLQDHESDTYKKQVKEIEKTNALLAQNGREIELASAAHQALIQQVAQENKLLDLQAEQKKKEFAKTEDEKRERGLERQLSIQEQFQAALEDQFVLDAKLKGVQDDKVAQAYAYLNATGQSAQAARLLTLELDKQKNSLSGQVSILSQAGSQIARMHGLNVDAISGQGTSLSDRSQLRNLASGFNASLGSEERRLRKSGIRDEEVIQQKLGQFSEQNLSPTLRRAVGITQAEEAQKGTKKEEDQILQGVDIAQMRAEDTKKLQALGKEETNFHKEFGDYVGANVEEITRLRDQLKAAVEKIRAK